MTLASIRRVKIKNTAKSAGSAGEKDDAISGFGWSRRSALRCVGRGDIRGQGPDVAGRYAALFAMSNGGTLGAKAPRSAFASGSLRHVHQDVRGRCAGVLATSRAGDTTYGPNVGIDIRLSVLPIRLT